METIIKIELPLKRFKKSSLPKHFLPRMERYFGWMFQLNRFSISEFGGSRTNTTHRLSLFRWHVLTVHRNEYHNKSDRERAEEYLSRWSKCEKELRMFRLAALGEGIADDVKRVINESLGVDLDEGTVR